MAKAMQDDEAIAATVRELVLDEKPQNFNPYEPGNVLMAMEEQFEQTCAAMEEMGVKDPKKLTEFEFYSRLKYYEKKHKNATSKSV